MFRRIHARRRDERGVVLPVTIGTLAATMMLASFVIDLGGDRVVRRDMQAVADVVALDLVRSLDGRTAGAYTGYSAVGPSLTLMSAEKAESLSRQSGLLWAEVTEITCTPSVTRVRMNGDTAVGRLKLHLDIGILGGLSVVKADVPDPDKRPDGAEIGKSKSNPVTFVFNPGNEIPAGQTVGNAMQNLGLQTTSPIKTEVLGLPLGNLNNLLNTVLSGVDGHLNSLLNPILTGLGLRLGTVEVRPTTRPSCAVLVLSD